MNSGPLISIVIPIYNVEKYLSRCIGSVLNQTYQNYECILVDDGSTDESGLLAEQFADIDARVKVFHKCNGGLSEARNYGIKESVGEYLTFIDSDDWVYPDYLEVLLHDAQEYDADIVVSPLARFENASFSMHEKRVNNICKVYSQKEYLDIFFRINGNRTVHYACGKIYKSSVIVDDQYPVGVLNEDVEGFFRALLKSNLIVETKRQLYCYFLNPDGITGSLFGNNYLNLTEVWSRIVSIAESERADLVPYAKYNLIRADFTILCDMLLHGNQETDVMYGDEQTRIQQRLRKNLRKLLRGPMALNRKIFAIAVAIFYSQIRYLIRKKDGKSI